MAHLKIVSLCNAALIALLISFSSVAAEDPYDYMAIERPITAEKLFPRCNPNRGIQTSSLCDAWDRHIRYLESQLDEMCVAAGEGVTRTAKGVNGVYLTGMGGMGGRANVGSGLAYPYPSDVKPNATIRVVDSLPLNGIYRLIEEEHYSNASSFGFTDHKNSGGGILRREVVNATVDRMGVYLDEMRTVEAQPKARYEINYAVLTDKEQQSKGLFGNKTTIRDRRTNEIIAERTLYYYKIFQGLKNAHGHALDIVGTHKFDYIVPCKNYTPNRVNKNHPHGIHEFVFRILKPTPWSDEARITLYDLTQGSGLRRERCVSSVRFGPDVTLQNLTIEIDKKSGDLSFGLTGSQDSFTCGNHFDGRVPDLGFYFASGAYLSEKGLFSHFKHVTKPASASKQRSTNDMEIFDTSSWAAVIESVNDGFTYKTTPPLCASMGENGASDIKPLTESRTIPPIVYKYRVAATGARKKLAIAQLKLLEKKGLLASTETVVNGSDITLYGLTPKGWALSLGVGDHSLCFHAGVYGVTAITDYYVKEQTWEARPELIVYYEEGHKLEEWIDSEVIDTFNYQIDLPQQQIETLAKGADGVFRKHRYLRDPRILLPTQQEALDIIKRDGFIAHFCKNRACVSNSYDNFVVHSVGIHTRGYTDNTRGRRTEFRYSHTGENGVTEIGIGQLDLDEDGRWRLNTTVNIYDALTETRTWTVRSEPVVMPPHFH